MLKGLKPLSHDNSKILILGSMPSVTSLQDQEYYAFPSNRFWKIIQLFSNHPCETYEEKKEALFSSRIALWDVIQSCERTGSLDSNIKNISYNPIDDFLQEHPMFQVVLCNGRKSYDLYQKRFSNLEIPCYYLPSTSSANQRKKEDALVKEWLTMLIKYK